MVHITLPAFNSGGQLATRETLEVEPLDGGQYRLLHSPAFVDGIAAGDVIALDPHAPSEYRVIRRSGHLAVVVSVPNAEDAGRPEVGALRDFVTECGGTFDGGPPRMLVFSVPVSAGFLRVEAAFNAMVAAVSGSTWWYGNVYEGGDEKRPLNWWRP